MGKRELKALAKERAEKEAKAHAVYSALWATPRYAALHELKSRIFRAWRHAEYVERDQRKASMIDARYRRVVRRIHRCECRAFTAAGLIAFE
jgi:hypothetical protein